MDQEIFEVFVENEAGSRIKRSYDEQSLTLLKSQPVSSAYPFAYGFVPGTCGDDGDAIDCFVLTDEPIASGTRVMCSPLGLLEKIEDGKEDHKVIAVPYGRSWTLSPFEEAALRHFLVAVFAHVPGKTANVGRLLGELAARDYVRRSRPGAG